jgi:acyl-CoA dehydrogenase
MDRETSSLLLDTIRRYVREKLVPLEAEVAETSCVPESVLADFRQMGMYGLTVPEKYGGLGLSAAEEVQAVIELTWASVAFRSAVSINLGVGSQCLVMDGTEEQKQEWLPKLAAGAVASFALTEPGSGSDSAGLMTRAVRDGDHYVLNGTKRFITNAPVADLITVMARTHPERLPKNAHITAFLIPANTPGLRIGPKDRKMGQAGALSADVYLEDVRVPAKNVLGGVEGRGFITAMKVLDRGRLNVSAMCVGQARRILNEALTYSMQRTQFGKPIGEHQLVQAMLADSRAELYAAECMLADAARRYDAGERISLEASCCKMYASEMAGRVADRAVQIHGGAGYMRDSAVERLYRDVRLFRIYEGTTQIQQIVIARELLRHGPE